MTTPATPIAAPRQAGRPLSFLFDDGLRPSRLGGQPGVLLTVRLTSYRSLPLSCIREITLSIDGVIIDIGTVTFLLAGNAHALAALRERTDLWWYILDPAEIFIPLTVPLRPGEHLVEGSLSTIVPYATGGRSTDTQHASRRLRLDVENETKDRP